MALKLSKSEIASILDGEATEVVDSSDEPSAVGVEFDSRRVKGGELFVALKGEKVHGHEHLEKAFASGASLALVEDADLLESSSQRERLIAVEDTYQGLAGLAAYWRESLALPLLAITGSVGKTSTKEMAVSLLKELAPGKGSIKSFNNHIEVPYTICSFSREDKWGVLEMGMNHKGELSELSGIAKPNVALITGIAPVHMEFFSDLP